MVFGRNYWMCLAIRSARMTDYRRTPKERAAARRHNTAVLRRMEESPIDYWTQNFECEYVPESHLKKRRV